MPLPEKTILVVDDDLEIRETIRDVLEEEDTAWISPPTGSKRLLSCARSRATEPMAFAHSARFDDAGDERLAVLRRAKEGRRAQHDPGVVIFGGVVDRSEQTARSKGARFSRSRFELVRLLDAVLEHAK